MNAYTYWLDTLRPSELESLNSDPGASLPRRVDVLIVGAGYTGLSAARTLAKSGASVLVVDRQCVGGGASSRNAGQVLTGLRPDPASLVTSHGERQARRLFDAANAAIDHLAHLIATESIECGFRRTGHLQAAWKPSHFDAFRREQSLLSRVFAHRVDLIGRESQRAELGSGRYHGLLVDETSAALNPAQLVHGLAAAARRAGACLATGITVEHLDRIGRRWSATTSRGSLEASDVMIATNGYTGAVTPAIRKRLFPIGSYIIVTEPLDEARASAILPKGRMAFDSKYFLYYFRLTDDRRLLFGGRAQFTKTTPATTRRAGEILQSGMIAIFPELADIRVDYAWGGNVAFSRDQLPHGGRLHEMYFAAGYCGHGIALATALGDLVARRINSGAAAVPDHPLLEKPLPAIPLYGGTPWFLPLVGAYYRVKDWLT